MKLLFSGAKYLNGEQKESNLSLGGFMSSTAVPNSKLNAIFSDLSMYDLQNKVVNCIALFIYNDTLLPIENLTLQQVYEQYQGKYTNLADFDFAVVEVASNGSIELIGSNFEEPFYADWFNCESRLEDCVLKLNNAGTALDSFSVFGINGNLTGNTMLSFQEDIMSALSGSGLFACSKISETEIYVQKVDFEITNSNSNFSTSGIASIENKNLSGGKLDKTLIADSILPGKSIGFWIRRKINDNYKEQESLCLTLEEQKLKNDTKEDFKLVFELD